MARNDSVTQGVEVSLFRQNDNLITMRVRQASGPSELTAGQVSQIRKSDGLITMRALDMTALRELTAVNV